MMVGVFYARVAVIDLQFDFAAHGIADACDQLPGKGRPFVVDNRNAVELNIGRYGSPSGAKSCREEDIIHEGEIIRRIEKCASDGDIALRHNAVDGSWRDQGIDRARAPDGYRIAVRVGPIRLDF